MMEKPNKNWEILENKLLGERFYRTRHATGLEIQVLPKPDYASVFAYFSTKYGSIDTAIIEGDVVTKIPEGTAHFLEHKLFESEDLDAFARFSKTGASANAFTSFDRTCYEFTSTGQFEENLTILLDFVQTPYFTQATVDKEQGIIGQEIRMGLDRPGSNVFFALLKMLYPKHPVHIEIAGTQESIAEISSELLHKCYQHFYNLHNMALCIVGNVSLEIVEKIADKLLKPGNSFAVRRERMPDPDPPTEHLSVKQMSVTVPLFALGCKTPTAGQCATQQEIITTVLALEILTGTCSPLYETLLQEGLINDGFSAELLEGDDYFCTIFGGESHFPQRAAEQIKLALCSAAQEGLSEEVFELARKKSWGSFVMQFNNVEALAYQMTETYFANSDIFEHGELLRNVTLEDVNAQLKRLFREDFFALSIIEPLETEENA